MKKTLSLLLAALMAFAAFGAAAESVPEAGTAPAENTAETKAPAAGTQAEPEGAPATVGDYLADEGFTGMMSVEPKYLALVVREGDRYIRVVSSLDSETFGRYLGLLLLGDEDSAQADALIAALPVSYTEDITAVPLSQAELDAAAGKTVSELEAEGFELSASEADEENVTFTMARGLYDYSFAMNATAAEYAQLAETDGFGALTVRTALGAEGLSRNAANLAWQADGTYAAPETEAEPETGADPFTAFLDGLAGLWNRAAEEGGAALEKGEQKLNEFAAGLEDKASEAAETGETTLDELLKSLTEAGENGKSKLDELLSSLGETLNEAGKNGKAALDELLKSLAEAGESGKIRVEELLSSLGEALNRAGEDGKTKFSELLRYLEEKKPELVDGFSSLLDSFLGLFQN